MATDTKIRTISHAEWMLEGHMRFGDNKRAWKFKCPVCGHIQTAQDFLDLGLSVDEMQGYLAFSCIGRVTPDAKGTIFNGKSPCNYTSGGLFKLNNLQIEFWNEEKKRNELHPVFEYAVQ